LPALIPGRAGQADSSYLTRLAACTLPCVLLPGAKIPQQCVLDLLGNLYNTQVGGVQHDEQHAPRK